MTLFWFTIFLLIFPQNGRLSDADYDPIFEICADGVPDVVVTLSDGTHCLLKGEYLFEIDTSRENASQAVLIKERWKEVKADENVVLAFTMSGIEWSEVNDKTILVQGNKYYVYKNFELESSHETKNWFDTKTGVVPNEAFYDQVVHQKDDAVIAFRHRKMLHLYETAMLFDDHHRPERVNVYRVASALHPSVLSILDSSQAYYLVPSVGDAFHLYFQSGDEGFFCFLSAFNSRCSPKKVTMMFDCPKELAIVRRKHFLGTITSRYRITTGDFILCVLGLTMGTTVIFVSLLLPLVSKYRKVRKNQEDLVALQENDEE